MAGARGGACGAVHARDLETTACKLQRVTARPAAEIEDGCPLRGMDEGKNLLGFADGDVMRAKLREKKVL